MGLRVFILYMLGFHILIYFFGLFGFPFVLFICLLAYPVGFLLLKINSRSVSQLPVSLEVAIPT